MNREPNTQYVLSLSYGKDSIACLAAIEQLGLPLDRIVHAEVWATDTIPADLPPMVEFKKKADAIIKDRWGIEVEHICAMRGGGESVTRTSSTKSTPIQSSEITSTDSPKISEDGVTDLNIPVKLTYQNIFYRPINKPRTKVIGGGRFKTTGFPMQRTPWCNGYLKAGVLDKNIRFPDAERSVVQQRTQTPVIAQDFQRDGVNFAQGNSRKSPFLQAPRHKVLK